MFDMKFKYKTQYQIASLTPCELIAYKRAMITHLKALREEIADFNYTYKVLVTEMQDRAQVLDEGLLEAELDRIESAGVDFGIVGFIH